MLMQLKGRQQYTRKMNTMNSTSTNLYNKFHSKCVCEICTCGNHHCPVHSKKQNDNFDTTHKTSYKAYDPRRQKPCVFDRPILNTSYDPNLLKSNYQQDYTIHNLPPVEKRQQIPLVKDNQPFYADSEYKQNFTKHTTHLNKKKAKDAYVAPPGIFGGTSTYNQDFTKHPFQNNQPIRGETRGGPDMNAKTGSTTYKEDFLKHSVALPEKPNQFKQGNVYGNPGQAEKESVYLKDFRNHGLQKYEKHQCPIIEMPSRPDRLSPGKSHINYDVVSNRWN